MFPGALLTAIYLSAGLAADRPVSPPPEAGHYWAYDLNRVVNPYGTLELGLESDPSRRFQIQFAVRHASSIPARDHGINSIELRATWRPFRR